jgi:hypothetical protein
MPSSPQRYGTPGIVNGAEWLGCTLMAVWLPVTVGAQARRAKLTAVLNDAGPLEEVLAESPQGQVTRRDTSPADATRQGLKHAKRTKPQVETPAAS